MRRIAFYLAAASVQFDRLIKCARNYVSELKASHLFVVENSNFRPVNNGPLDWLVRPKRLRDLSNYPTRRSRPAAMRHFHKTEDLPQSAKAPPLIGGKALKASLVDAKFLKLARTLRFHRCSTPIAPPQK
jgi:hypothetical protein